MNRRIEQTTYSNPCTSRETKQHLKKASSLTESMASMLMTKLSLQEMKTSQGCESNKKSVINIGQPLTFSTRSNSKKRLSYFGQSNIVTKGRRSKVSAFNMELPHFCKELKQSMLQNQRIQNEIDELKTNNQETLNILTQNKRQLHNINSNLQSKCEQVQTLKSIINSIKDYVFRDKKSTPNSSTQQVPSDQNKPLPKPQPSYKRRVSINQNFADLKSEDELQKQVLMKLQEYAHMKLSKSMESQGQVGDIYSYNIL